LLPVVVFLWVWLWCGAFLGGGGVQADVEIYSVLNSFPVRVPISFPVV
jgi:hypothetical protein